MLLKILSFVLFSGCLVFASMMVFASYTKTMFVLDRSNLHELPRYFRKMTELKISGGGQYSHAGFASILRYLDVKQLVVIDLRQESHGFLNGQAVSWYGVHNANNSKKSKDQIERDQAKLLAEVAKKKQMMVDRVGQKSEEGRIKKLKPILVAVKSVQSESDWLKEQGQLYFRLYVQDFHAPKASEVDRFIEIFKTLPKEQWIYFHCRAGIGRTTVFMALYDMLLNAKLDSFDEIMDRQVAMGGKDLRKLIHHSHFKHQWHKERLNFLNDFYQYARDNQDGFETSFSAWLTTKG